ncbi:hypothetical protein AADZ90_008110 [Aestuariibius sp. 2305UL40-4]|uniref:hypothetical protein n=1 Tax=Aestuariibius violaceus TaxID=3234132 RepID=UPI00345E25A4
MTLSKGLTFGAAIMIGFGSLMALAALPALNLPIRLLADLILWPMDGAETLAAPESRLLLAISGGVLAGWGVLVLGLAGEPARQAPDTTRRIALTAYVAWFAIDSTASVAAGAPLNVVGNLAFLALMAGPILKPTATIQAT